MGGSVENYSLVKDHGCPKQFIFEFLTHIYPNLNYS